ncbi:hypothetical protein Ae201684P_014834 [Aphanomyces euteiches]|nr:hypothetical protein Ae201684P_014834 [Aphanomyces euteiches]KAH9138586.1 hypothetical protein AeRB84_017097 [Aphanomyces euteiches]
MALFNMPSLCCFKGCVNPCSNPVTGKCELHKHKGRCSMPQCANQVYARGLCVRHGAKRRCQVPNCMANARRGNVCSSHGAPTMRKGCTEPGCTKIAQMLQKCVAHGGGRRCKMEGCMTYARAGGYCVRHGRELVLRSSALANLDTALMEPVTLDFDLINLSDDSSGAMTSPHLGDGSGLLSEGDAVLLGYFLH